MKFDRFRLRLTGQCIFLRIFLFVSVGMASYATALSATAYAIVGESSGQKPSLVVVPGLDARQEVAASSALSATLSSKIFMPAMYRDYDQPFSKIFVPIVYRDYKRPLAPLCRYGVVAWGQQLKWLPTWRAGWTLDLAAHAPPAGIAAEFVQVIRVRQQKNGCEYLDGYSTVPALTEAGLGAVTKSAPGAIWIIGNEPDRGPNPENCLGPAQDDTYPEVYARAYHDTFQFIKQRDPSAQIAIAGLVQVTPGRLQYLDKVWEEYRRLYGSDMPVDIWNMHLYILPEALPDGRPNGIANIALGTDPALAIRESGGDPNRCGDPDVYCFAEHDDMAVFAEQVVAMRTWMKQRGQQQKPLIISEYSLLYPYELDEGGCFLQDEYGRCFTPERVNTFMRRSFDYLETAADPDLGYGVDRNRLVQRWMWFSAYHPGAGSVSNLLSTHLGSLSSVGAQFRDAVEARPAVINLRAIATGGHSGYIDSTTGTTSAELWVDILNNGSMDSSIPFTITFYADSQLSQPIGSTIFAGTLRGCSTGPRRVSVRWDGLSAGVHPFWVKLDSSNMVAEEDETDNIISGTVTSYGYGIFLPIMLR